MPQKTCLHMPWPRGVDQSLKATQSQAPKTEFKTFRAQSEKACPGLAASAAKARKSDLHLLHRVFSTAPSLYVHVRLHFPTTFPID